MTYLEFHLYFLLPPLFVLAYTLRRPLQPAVGPRAGMAVSAICLVALVYTTPWDNYLVREGIWGYGAERVIGTIGYVPIEEYLFFILQPVIVSLLLLRLLGPAAASSSRLWGFLILLFYLAITVLGFACLAATDPHFRYLGLILAWAGPVLFLLWAYAGMHLLTHRRALLLTLLPASVYLWVADLIAIRLGIWTISPTYATGLHLLGLPIEEAVFFFVTNLLVVQGTLVFLHGDQIRPFALFRG